MKDVPLARRRCLQVSALAGWAAEYQRRKSRYQLIVFGPLGCHFDLKSCCFDQGRLVRLKQFESRGDIAVIGDGVIKDRITVLAVS